MKCCAQIGRDLIVFIQDTKRRAAPTLQEKGTPTKKKRKKKGAGTYLCVAFFSAATPKTGGDSFRSVTRNPQQLRAAPQAPLRGAPRFFLALRKSISDLGPLLLKLACCHTAAFLPSPLFRYDRFFISILIPFRVTFRGILHLQL